MSAALEKLWLAVWLRARGTGRADPPETRAWEPPTPGLFIRSRASDTHQPNAEPETLYAVGSEHLTHSTTPRVTHIAMLSALRTRLGTSAALGSAGRSQSRPSSSAATPLNQRNNLRMIILGAPVSSACRRKERSTRLTWLTG